MKRLLCKLGVHRWEGTIFVGDRFGVGDACRWCDLARIEKNDGWHYFGTDGSER